MNYDDLNPELLEKAKACETPEELLALAKEEGYELTDEQLEAVAGGIDTDWMCLSVVTCENKACIQYGFHKPKGKQNNSHMIKLA